MALPLSRNRTYAIGDPVVAADLNDLQDQDIAIFSRIEQGFFTPIIVNNGVDHATYTAQRGVFLRVDDFVWFQMQIIATTLDPAGTLRIKRESLPFIPVASSSEGPLEQAGSVARFQGGGGGVPADVSLRITENAMSFQDDASAGTETNWSALGSATYTFVLGGCYKREP